MKTTTLPSTNLVKRSPLRAFLLVPFVLGCFGLSPQARAVCQEGCDAVNFNTFLGEDALLDHSGVSNTAVGWHALKNNPNASWNTAIGTEALENNISGYYNTATGVGALGNNTGGHNNTATGSNALFANTTGSDNTATGFAALGSTNRYLQRRGRYVGALWQHNRHREHGHRLFCALNSTRQHAPVSAQATQADNNTARSMRS